MKSHRETEVVWVLLAKNKTKQNTEAVTIDVLAIEERL